MAIWKKGGNVVELVLDRVRKFEVMIQLSVWIRPAVARN